MMLDTAKKFRQVFNSLEIQDPNYTFNPSHEEWDNAATVCRLLKVFYEATNVISGTKYPTANLYLHEMLKVKLTLDQQAFEEESEMHSMLKYMKKKFDKSQGVDIEMGTTDNDPLATWDRHVTVRAQSGGEASLELESYLSKVPIRRSDRFNILTWWQMNSSEYPTLSRMARDMLAVPASTVASESAFSTGSRVLSDFRSRMTPETVEALVCLQDWIRASGNTQRSMDSVHDITVEGEEEP
ncbi:hypothetical protein U9M48_011797 [Paspalum notatum var. saurae]|uniref:HAT C-terminal dimerisation domain-containing protein n=1 Tax=Paspalum notatum var. saurae TaxID=547442 RepID=A0AAQ3SW91_PASNO